jgi:hypothetical protein
VATNPPPAATIDDEDIDRFIAQHPTLPGLRTCTCDAAPYRHIAQPVPYTEAVVCFVVKPGQQVIVLRVTDG